MRCLIESSVKPWLPALQPTRPTPVARLHQSEQCWWPLLSRAENLHVLDATSFPAARMWQALAIVDDSPISQFDILVDASRTSVELPENLACLALTGTGFHGNRRRPWHALRGNLHFSSFSRFRLNAARCGPALSMLPTLAVTDVLRPRFGNRCWIKWVNDVYLDDAKVSGSLVSTDIRGEAIQSFVLGIGVNVESVPNLTDSGFAPRVTSLRREGMCVALSEVFDCLLVALSNRLRQLRETGPESWFGDYHRRSGVLGRIASVFPEHASSPSDIAPLATGRVQAIHPDLSLQLDSRTESFQNGRLHLHPERSVFPLTSRCG